MPSPLSYRPHFHRDWISSSTVRKMSYAARGIYQDLLDVQWEEGCIETEPSDIQGVLRCSDAEWAEFAPYLDKCFPVTDSGRQNPRCAAERDKANQKVERNRANASEGGKAKARNNPSDGLANAKANASETLKPNPSDGLPIPDTDTDIPPSANALTPKGVEKRFVKPTLEQVSEEMDRLGLPPGTAEKFMAHYGSNGWKVGRNPMKDWKHACVTWRHKYDEHQKPGLNGRTQKHESVEEIYARL